MFLLLKGDEKASDTGRAVSEIISRVSAAVPAVFLLQLCSGSNRLHSRFGMYL